MGALFVALALATGLADAQAVPPLESRAPTTPLVTLQPVAPMNFDLYDVRAELNEPRKYSEAVQHSIFGLKRHIGVAGGYDSGVLHGSVGLYVTVAEWGRWNFGAASPELGFGRYHVFDKRQRKLVTQFQSTILISLASIHYRGGYLQTIKKVWYVNLEQVFDSRGNFTGSQVGFSFANR